VIKNETMRKKMHKEGIPTQLPEARPKKGNTK